MVMESRHLPLSEITCENGLKASIFDHSRLIPGDRWQVDVRMEVSVHVRKEYFNECPDPSEAYRDFVAEFGENINFEQQKVRNFISREMRGELTQTMARELLESVASYLGKPDFPSKFVMKRYRDWKKNEGWRRAQEKLLKQGEQTERES